MRRSATTVLNLFLVAAAIAAAAWPSAAVAQAKVPRIGVLTVDASTKGAPPHMLEVFRRSLAQEGWLEGKTLRLVVHDVAGSTAKFSRAAAELVSQQVDVIYAESAPALRAAFAATKSIPIVGIDYTNDPLATGYAKSYARPGGNVTGVFLDAPGFAGKSLELLREIVPKLKHVAVVWDPSPGDTHVKALTSIAASLGMQLTVMQVHEPQDIDGAAAALATATPPQAMVILPSAMLFREQTRLVNLATKHRLPAVSMAVPFADAGGLLAYGPDDLWSIDRAAILTSKVLRGAKPGD